jgi:ABC-type nitrate/sulfonate/bicarbonate transport system permease component
VCSPGHCDARTVLRTDYVIGMMTIGLVGMLIDRLIRALSRAMMPWSRVLSR